MSCSRSRRDDGTRRRPGRDFGPRSGRVVSRLDGGRARAAGLCGWVRNRKDGTVEAVFAGPPKAIEAMIAECRDGPPLAKVDAIAHEDAQDEGWTGFSQMPTTA